MLTTVLPGFYRTIFSLIGSISQFKKKITIIDFDRPCPYTHVNFTQKNFLRCILKFARKPSSYTVHRVAARHYTVVRECVPCRPGSRPCPPFWCWSSRGSPSTRAAPWWRSCTVDSPSIPPSPWIATWRGTRRRLGGGGGRWPPSDTGCSTLRKRLNR